MSCDNVITVHDLETDKKHSTYYREVVTGKAGGTGADIDFATNAVTGQIQKTLTKAINELGGMGYARVGTFKTGATLTTARDTLLWDIADGGDGQEYGWSGLFPKVVPDNSTPSSTGGIAVGVWMSRFDPELRAELAAPSGAGMVGGLPVFVTATKYAGGATTSSTSNDAAIIAAINDAMAADSYVYWPAVYEVQGNIPNFHSVRHDGPGGIKRAGVVYRVHPLEWHSNTLNVATTGSATNDGLTASFPMLELSAACAALRTIGRKLAGSWTVNIAAGTYAQYATLDGVESYNRIIFTGPEASGGLPSAIFDGAGLHTLTLNGFLLTNGTYAQVKDIFFKNWAGASGVGPSDASTGLNISYSNVYADNCWFDSCGTGLSATMSRLYQGRGKVINCAIGSTAYGQTTFTFGYGGATEYSGSTVIGVNYRDGSSGVVDGGIFIGCDLAVKGTNQSHTRVSNCSFTGSATADVYLYTGSSAFFGEGNTHTAGKKLVTQSAMDLENATEMMFFGDSKRWSFGLVGSPGYKWHWRTESSGSFVSGANTFVIEGNSPSIGFNSSASGAPGINIAKPGVSTEASWIYTCADGNWRVRAGNTDSYRFASTVFRPVPDGTINNGGPANRWSTVFAATGTINTSDAREKTDPLPIDDKILDAWGDVNFITFQWLESIRQNGVDAARWHFGVIAQQVRDTFLSHGLDGCNYGLLCYDEWEDEPEATDEDGNVTSPAIAAGDRWGIRPDQCLFLEAAYQRRNYQRLAARIEALESKQL